MAKTQISKIDQAYLDLMQVQSLLQIFEFWKSRLLGCLDEVTVRAK